MKREAERAQKWMNLNSVALCFQGFCYGENNVLYPLTDKIYSRPINNLSKFDKLVLIIEYIFWSLLHSFKFESLKMISFPESALTGELKICRTDRHTGTCEGGDEVWWLVEKVGKSTFKHVQIILPIVFHNNY